MGTVLTIRVSEETSAEIERISEEKGLDRHTVIRQLLTEAVQNYRQERAFEEYQNGELSVEGLSKEADLSIRQALSELRERSIHVNYSETSLREDSGR